jgi:hypothetical protein
MQESLAAGLDVLYEEFGHYYYVHVMNISCEIYSGLSLSYVRPYSYGLPRQQSQTMLIVMQ